MTRITRVSTVLAAATALASISLSPALACAWMKEAHETSQTAMTPAQEPAEEQAMSTFDPNKPALFEEADVEAKDVPSEDVKTD